MTDAYAAAYNPHDPLHVLTLARLHRERMSEADSPQMLDMDGFPVARYLRTAFIVADAEAVGYLAIETRPADGREPSLELIYLLPRARGKGIARQVVAEAQKECPATLHIKGPLSARGKALAEALGMPEDTWTPQQQKEADEARLEGIRNIAAACPHKRPNPTYACKKCRRVYTEAAAECFIAAHALFMNGNAGPAGPTALAIIDKHRKKAERLGLHLTL